MSRTITIDHVARVEGHGGITVVLDGDRVERVEFAIFEGIRLFEGLLRGRDVLEVPGIVSRICAICSHNHAITAVEALERALGVDPTPQTMLLRDLAFQGAAIESHALHAFVLALPDFVNHESVITLAGTHPEVVRLALNLKKLGNTIQEVTGGRAVHPVNYVVGGFGRLPSQEDLVRLRDLLERGIEDCQRAIEFLSGVPLPEFPREDLEFAALVPRDAFFFFGRTIRHSDGTAMPVEDYRRFTAERTVPHSHAKHSRWQGRPFMVGAQARLALNGDRIGGLARDAWERLRFDPRCGNVLANSIAQVIEIVFSVQRALAIVTRLLQEGVVPEPPVPFERKAGAGVAATEVPRGTLYHAYELDASGRVVAADVITPTAQNLAHAEGRMRTVVEGSVGLLDDATLKHRLEMVARAYDPCISCSVHVVRTGRT